ncbi:MAG: DUF3179 domain-containing protein [Myxococcales bacterium]|nr:DUF3179 domain-containing protein [Myxococcales bacterium]MDH3845804.1 DUF3179 domain-containing protein [Myxococcales bacterium]
MRRTALSLLVALLAWGCSSAPAEDTTPNNDGADGDINPPVAASRIAEFRLADQSGSRWYLDGTADTAATNLSSVPGHNAFWFAWSVFHPGTDIWEGEPISNATIEPDPSGDCTVPCNRIFQGCGGGRDCIPPLDSPTMVAADSPNAQYLADTDFVLGVLTSEGPRAYPHNILWWHEIANEEVGGDAYAVTLCPLTGSGLAFDRRGFVQGQTVRLGVSGLLYNSNLVMWDGETESLWSQMRLESVQGSEIGSPSPLRGVLEMTWGAWKALHADTLVISEETGFPRDYQRYPYVRGGADYRVNDADTFAPTEPTPDAQFENKDMVFGVIWNGEVKGYPWETLEAQSGARQGVIADSVGGRSLSIVFDLDSGFVHAFESQVDGTDITLSIEAP